MNRTILILVSTLLVGCTGLDPKNEGFLENAGEVAGRSLAGVFTLGLSEVALANERKAERARARNEAAYAQWYRSLTPEQQARADQREHERGLAAMQALGQMQMNGPMFSLPALRPHTAPQYNEWAPTPRTRTNCTTNLYGNQAQTYCY